MERCAMFIDAGYLLAEAGDLLFNTLNRGGNKERPSCNYEKLLPRLQKLACEHCQLPILRIYWYDAAPQNVPTDEQKNIARLPNVKVRLGRMVSGQQKGVDALIYRDLMTLTQQHAIATGYLFSGDEDLKEGVIVAQDMGVRIILLGVPSRQGRGPNQSDFLVREADEHIIVEENILESCFSPRGNPNTETLTATNAEINNATQVGQAFAATWNRNATPEQIRELQTHDPTIPPDIDRELLREAEQIFGSLEGAENKKQTLKHNLRRGFWGVIRDL